MRLYASSTHDTLVTDACKDSMIAGTAMLTMVMSNRLMNMPSDTAVRMNHLRGSPVSRMPTVPADGPPDVGLLGRAASSVRLMGRLPPKGRVGDMHGAGRNQSLTSIE